MVTATILLKKLRENCPRLGYEDNSKWASFVDVEFSKADFCSFTKELERSAMHQIVRRSFAKMPQVQTVISTNFLKQQMDQKEFSDRFKVIDASWDLPSAGRDTEKEHMEKRIMGARFFNVDACCDKNSDLPHMLPKTEDFERYVTNLGVCNHHHIILYDNSPKFGMFSAPRVWWTFRVFGHNMVSVLDGGLPKWIADGLPVETGRYEQHHRGNEKQFTANFRPHLVKNITSIKENLASGNIIQVVDARPSGRFRGTAPEPRPDITSGHMPKSLNVPFIDCLGENRLMKSPEELRKLLKANGVDLSKEMIASCGSGVSACIVALAAKVCNDKEVPVYDGSWVEWATKEPDNIVKEN